MTIRPSKMIEIKLKKKHILETDRYIIYGIFIVTLLFDLQQDYASNVKRKVNYISVCWQAGSVFANFKTKNKSNESLVQ